MSVSISILISVSISISISRVCPRGLPGNPVLASAGLGRDEGGQIKKTRSSCKTCLWQRSCAYSLLGGLVG